MNCCSFHWEGKFLFESTANLFIWFLDLILCHFLMKFDSLLICSVPSILSLLALSLQLMNIIKYLLSTYLKSPDQFHSASKTPSFSWLYPSHITSERVVCMYVFLYHPFCLAHWNFAIFSFTLQKWLLLGSPTNILIVKFSVFSVFT